MIVLHSLSFDCIIYTLWVDICVFDQTTLLTIVFGYVPLGGVVDPLGLVLLQTRRLLPYKYPKPAVSIHRHLGETWYDESYT